MSVQTEINRITQNIENTYNVLEALGCDMPTEKTSDNLAPTAGTSKVVLYKEQTLTEEQKTQARTNIGAVSETKVSQLEKQVADYETHRTDTNIHVTSAEKQAWDSKLDSSELSEAVNTALAQAKESGDFKGDKGDSGYTPVKGTDYFTTADKNELVNLVLAELPTYDGTVV